MLILDQHKNDKKVPRPITPREAELIFWLVAREIIFLSTFDEDINDWTNHFYTVVNISDTFYYASADADYIENCDLECLKYYYEKYSWDGVTAYVASRRGIEPVSRLKTDAYYNAMKELSEKAYGNDSIK